MASASKPALLSWGALAFLAAILFAAVLAMRPVVPGPADVSEALGDILLWQSLLPRAVSALICGAMLGLSGALLQRVLRIPIADPSTLGIASGAQLALTAATAYAPLLIELKSGRRNARLCATSLTGPSGPSRRAARASSRRR